MSIFALRLDPAPGLGSNSPRTLLLLYCIVRHFSDEADGVDRFNLGLTLAHLFAKISLIKLWKISRVQNLQGQWIVLGLCCDDIEWIEESTWCCPIAAGCYGTAYASTPRSTQQTAVTMFALVSMTFN